MDAQTIVDECDYHIKDKKRAEFQLAMFFSDVAKELKRQRGY